MYSFDGVYTRSLVGSVSGLIRFGYQEGIGVKGLHHSVHFCVHCIVCIAIAISSVGCAGAGVSSIGIAGRFTTTGIGGSRTQAEIEYGETPFAGRAPCNGGTCPRSG